MQSTNSILLIRPSNFFFNTETALSNSFQNSIDVDNGYIAAKVLKEFENFREALNFNGVDVTTINDTESPIKPDAIFPNNWVSCHADGTVILYPMLAENRRYERRLDVIKTLKEKFIVKNIIDFSIYEKENKFLEGTGSIVFNHVHKIAYACLSPRTSKDIFVQLCSKLGYQPIYFNAYNQNGQSIYHTNVMLCVLENIAIICLDSITNPKDKELVLQSFFYTKHIIIDVSFIQMHNFACNVLALKINNNKNIVVLSQRAYDSLEEDKKNTIKNYYNLLPILIPTIETIGGGGVRCMIAEIFLPKR